jgi:hypothetical protein
MSHDQVAPPGQETACAAYKAAQRPCETIINIGHRIGEATGDDDTDKAPRRRTSAAWDVKHHGLWASSKAHTVWEYWTRQTELTLDIVVSGCMLPVLSIKGQSRRKQLKHTTPEVTIIRRVATVPGSMLNIKRGELKWWLASSPPGRWEFHGRRVLTITQRTPSVHANRC